MPSSLRIDRKIISTRFACDLAACKGACCTFPGGSGPPVSEDEVPILEEAWKVVRDMLPPEHVAEVKENGLIVHDGEELTIRCHDQRACVFVIYDGDIAKCSIQELHAQGKFSWPKPVSCHLFPIRVRGKHRDQLRFERFSECAPAFTEGERLDLPLVRFLEVPIRRAFGDAVYLELERRALPADVRAGEED